MCESRERMVSNTPTAATRKVYNQGLRRLKQKIEIGTQPKIIKLFSDGSGEARIGGGQPYKPVGTGGGDMSRYEKKKLPKQV